MRNPKSVQSNKGGREGGYKNGVPTKLTERNLTSVSPKTEQFAPTPAEPVRARYRMAGGC